MSLSPQKKRKKTNNFGTYNSTSPAGKNNTGHTRSLFDIGGSLPARTSPVSSY